MRTFLSPYPPRPFFTYTCGLFVMLAMMFLRTDTVVAQAESSDTELVLNEKNDNFRVGINFSGYGLLNDLACDLGRETECLDGIPFPRFQITSAYKNWQITSAWSTDENEFIFNMSGRYNYHPLQKYRFRPFIFAGISTWYFNRKWIYRKHNINSPDYISCDVPISCSSNDNVIRYEEITDPEFTYALDKSRPDGKSVTLGFTGGFGIEYNIGDLVFTHEFDLYQDLSGCPYSEFICAIRDFKFLGIHFPF